MRTYVILKEIQSRQSSVSACYGNETVLSKDAENKIGAFIDHIQLSEFSRLLELPSNHEFIKNALNSFLSNDKVDANTKEAVLKVLEYLDLGSEFKLLEMSWFDEDKCDEWARELECCGYSAQDIIDENKGVSELFQALDTAGQNTALFDEIDINSQWIIAFLMNMHQKSAVDMVCWQRYCINILSGAMEHIEDKNHIVYLWLENPITILPKSSFSYSQLSFKAENIYNEIFSDIKSTGGYIHCPIKFDITFHLKSSYEFQQYGEYQFQYSVTKLGGTPILYLLYIGFDELVTQATE